MANIERKGQDILSQVAIMTEPLIKHLRELIENTRKRVASVVSDETTQLYWNVGYAINTFVLQGNRAEYGNKLSQQCRDNWHKNLEVVLKRRMFAV